MFANLYATLCRVALYPGGIGASLDRGGFIPRGFFLRIEVRAGIGITEPDASHEGGGVRLE